MLSTAEQHPDEFSKFKESATELPIDETEENKNMDNMEKKEERPE